MVYCETPITPIGWIQALLTTSFFPIFPWAAYFFIGLWIGVKINPIAKLTLIEQKKELKKMLFLSFFMLISSIISEIIVESILGDVVYLPQNLQSNLAVELMWGIQPTTTSFFFFYAGFSMIFMSIFIYHFDMHPVDKISRSTKILSQLSRDCLTIYVLQFIWVIILRFIKLFDGIDLLYSIPDEGILTLMILGAFVLAMLFVSFHEKHQYRYGIEWMMHKLTI